MLRTSDRTRDKSIIRRSLKKRKKIGQKRNLHAYNTEWKRVFRSAWCKKRRLDKSLQVKKCRRSVKKNIAQTIAPDEKSSPIHVEEKGASYSVHPTAGKSPPIDDKKDVSMCSSRKEVVDPWIKIRFHDRLLAKKGSVEKSGRVNEGWNKFNLTRGKRAKKRTTPFQRSLVLREILGRGC